MAAAMLMTLTKSGLKARFAKATDGASTVSAIQQSLESKYVSGQTHRLLIPKKGCLGPAPVSWPALFSLCVLSRLSRAASPTSGAFDY
jgi:hypothetical protein